MPNTETTLKLSGASVESIGAVITQIVKSFDEDEQNRKDLREIISRRLKGNKRVRDDFIQWLKSGDFTSDLPWLAQVREGETTYEVLEQAALSCLQVMVMAYLPGTRYFQGAYIHSCLWDGTSLKSIKSAFRVPHLSGAVGWMTSRALNTEDPYVVIPDAQLDLRGRVAVPDLHLGNRSVLGFPVSLIANNKELASISGFVFFSHPVPGIFPQPSGHKSDAEKRLAEVFANIRRVNESAIASAIESFIFRRYGKSVLAAQLNPSDARRVPLLALSDDDPTGFLVSILFESDSEGNLKSECEISESVLLETTAWLLRIASIYPEKWAPRFVEHMMQLGQLIEKTDTLRKVPMMWFSRGDSSGIRKLYPPGSDLPPALANPTGYFDQTPPDAPDASQSPDGRGNIRQAMADAMALFGTHGDATRQADLVIPIYAEERERLDLMGFFRINCDASAIKDASQVPAAFHNLWRELKRIQDLMNPEAARLFLAVEQSLLDASHAKEEEPEGHAEQVQRIKLCTDTLNILSDWLAKKMHRLLSPLLPEEAAFSRPALTALAQQERLICFALDTLMPNAQLIEDFNKWTERCNAFSGEPASQSKASLPEVTFISFWPRLKLPIISGVTQEMRGDSVTDEDVFSPLMLSDPGLLRMLALMAPLLAEGEKIDMGPGRDLSKNKRGWEGVHFGIPASPGIIKLEVERRRGDGLVIDVKWEWRAQPQPLKYSARIKWNYRDAESQSRNFGGHAVSNIPGIVAHRIGENVLANLKLKPKKGRMHDLRNLGVDASEDLNILDFIGSSDAKGLQDQIGHLQRAMLYDESEAASWRLIALPASSSSPLTFLSALYNERIKRPSVLAFRDFAFANAKAFYSARLYDAQREAAEDYTHNLGAIAHGYKGPIRELKAAMNQAKSLFYEEKNMDVDFVSEEMKKLYTMVSQAKVLASDAIYYARRRTDPRPFETHPLSAVQEEIEAVIQALDLPNEPRVEFLKAEPDGEMEVKVRYVPNYWRHMLAKLVDNAIYHSTEMTGVRAFIEPEVDAERVVLRISNLVSAEHLDSRVERVHRGLVDGMPNIAEAEPNSKEENHGYGLLEAYNCCRLLGIGAKVEKIEAESKLVVSLDASGMIVRSN